MSQSSHPLLAKLRASDNRSIQDALRDVTIHTQVIQEFRPLVASLEWELSDLFWATEGVGPFATNRVPFIVNNSGRLSESAAAGLFSNCLEAGSLEDRILVLELGAGSGLFARYFLDAFRALCEQEGRDFYQRLVYFISDRSPRSARQWQELGLFAEHAEQVVMGICDSMRPADFRNLQEEQIPLHGLRAVFANYALDVLPAAIIRHAAAGPEQLNVRTRLTSDPGALNQYSQLSLSEIQALAAADSAAERDKLLPLLPLLEFETAFRPLTAQTLPPYAAEALEFGRELEKLALNYGAIDCLEQLLPRLDRSGFILINDYGPPTHDQVAAHASMQRFGASIALGINFPFLEHHFSQQGLIVCRPDGDDSRPVHARLICRGDCPQTLQTFEQLFSQATCEYFEGAMEEAKQHIMAGRYNDALESYRTALERNPRDWSLIGQAAEFVSLQLKDFQAGVELSRAAIELNPWYSAWLWNVLGDSLFCLNRFDEAHVAYLQAERIDPRDVRANFNLSYTYFQQGAYRDALMAIARGLAGDAAGAFRERLLGKQQQILTTISDRAMSEQERLLKRTAAFA